MKKMTQTWTKYLAIALLFVVPCMVSCSDDDDDTPGGEGGGQITLPASAVTSVPVSATAGERALVINFGDAWSVKLDKNVTWLDVNPKSGAKGAQTLTLKVKENETFANQSTDLTFTVGGTESVLKIVQDPAEKSIRVYEGEILLTADLAEVTLQRVITNVAEIEVASFPSWIEAVELTPVIEGAFTAKIQLKAGDFDSEIREGEIVFKEKESDFSVGIPVRMKSPDDFAFVSCPETVLGYDVDGSLGDITVEIATVPGREMQVVCYDYNDKKGKFWDGEVSYYALDPTKQPESKAAFTNETWKISVVCDGGAGEFTYENEYDDIPVSVSFGVFVIPADTDPEEFDPNAEGVKYRMVTITPFDLSKRAEFTALTIEGAGEGFGDGVIPSSIVYQQAGGQMKFTVKAICPIKVVMGTQNSSLTVSEDECGIVPDNFFTLSGGDEGTKDGSYTLYNYTLTIPNWTDYGDQSNRKTAIYIFETTANGKFIVEEEEDIETGAVTESVKYIQSIRIRQNAPQE